MILSAQSIMRRRPIRPFIEEQRYQNGLSYGLSAAGYDIRVAQTFVIPPRRLVLASSIEEFDMPDDLGAFVSTKSTWARRGVCNVGTTFIDPGFVGHLTVELFNYCDFHWSIEAGDPIAQIVFEQLDQPTIRPYSGKYSHQENRPVPARMEGA